MVQGYPRHVTFDWFLYNPPSYIVGTPSIKQCEEIGKLFPGFQGLNTAPPFLEVVVDYLPMEPWPVTVAGLPLHISTAQRRPFGRYGNVAGTARYLRLDTLEPIEACKRAKECLVSQGLPMHKVQLVPVGPVFYITLEDDTNVRKVPISVGDVMALYRYRAEETDAVKEKEKREWAMIELALESRKH